MMKLSYQSIIRTSGGDDPTSTLKILSNKNRYSILKLLLFSSKDLCVHEIADSVGMSQSATSHQLAYLEARGVVSSVRMGKTKCYIPTENEVTDKILAIIKSLT